MKSIRTLFKNEKGATAIEYGLIAALIAIAAIGALQGIGGKVSGLFNQVNTALPVQAAGNNG